MQNNALDEKVPTIATHIGISIYFAGAVVIISVPVMCILFCNRKRIGRMARVEHDEEEPMVRPPHKSVKSVH